jgi:signal transduction histidine kinase
LEAFFIIYILHTLAKIDFLQLKYTYYILISLFIFSCNKTNKIENKDLLDSLSIYLANTQNENKPIPFRLKYSEKAILLLNSQKNTSYSRNQLFNICKFYYEGKLDYEFKNIVFILIENSKSQKDIKLLAKSYNLLGNHYINLSKNDSAYYYLLKSEKLFLREKDSNSLGKNYVDKAFVQLYENDYSGCELSSITALNFLKNNYDKQLEYDAYNLIGISANELKNYENAIEYHNKALSIVIENKIISDFHYEASSKNNIGVVYQNINKHNKAKQIFKSALEEKNLLKDNPSLYAIITDNLAYSKFKTQDFNSLPSLFYESLRIREKNQMYSGIIANKIHLSEFYSFKMDTIMSQNFAIDALNLAKKTRISGDMLAALKQLSLVEHKNAAKYSKEYIKISDSIQLEERKSKDKFARIAFETDEIILEKDKLAEQNRSLLYFFVGTLFVGVLLFVIRTQRAKNMELILKQQQQKANEDIYNLMISQQATIEESREKEKKRIAQELHDGVLGRLFGARLNLDSLNRFTDDDSINNRFNYLNELKNIEQDIREISHDLNREKYVLINNFVAIVTNLIEEQKNAFSAQVNFTIDEKIKWDRVANTTKINLYRMLQEALQNCNKYANAAKIEVVFELIQDSIQLTISDNGNGFDAKSKKKGIGLQNMVSRTNECKGKLDVDSTKGLGTTIKILIPLTENTENN